MTTTHRLLYLTRSRSFVVSIRDRNAVLNQRVARFAFCSLVLILKRLMHLLSIMRPPS